MEISDSGVGTIRIVEGQVHAVDGEVPPGRIFLVRRKLHLVGGSLIGGMSILAEGSQIEFLAIDLHAKDKVGARLVPPLHVKNLVSVVGTPGGLGFLGISRCVVVLLGVGLLKPGIGKDHADFVRSGVGDEVDILGSQTPHVISYGASHHVELFLRQGVGLGLSVLGQRVVDLDLGAFKESPHDRSQVPVRRIGRVTRIVGDDEGLEVIVLTQGDG